MSPSRTPSFLLLAVLASAGATAAAARESADPPAAGEAPVPGAPSLREVVGLASVGSPRISPDGSTVAFVRTRADWQANRFDDEIWLARPGEEALQLTRTPDGGSSAAQWSPDGRYLYFLADRGEKRQVYRISTIAGEAEALTRVEDGVDRYRLAPDGGSIAFTSVDPAPTLDRREKRYGGFVIEDEDLRYTHLWVQALPAGEAGEAPEPRRLTGGTDYTVGAFDWSPDGGRIAFDHQPRPGVDAFVDADLSVVDVATATVTPLVRRAGPDSGPVFSPDGRWVAFSSPMGANPYYGNDRIARVSTGPAADGALPEPEVLTADFDEDARPALWNQRGIFLLANRRTARRLYRLDPQSRAIEEILAQPDVLTSVDASADGRFLALSGAGPTTLDEIYRLDLDQQGAAPQRLTDSTAQVEGWPLGTRRVVQWRSRDDEPIEGVLLEPEGIDPKRAAPLLVVIHGGPTGTSRPVLLSSYVYPLAQWLAKGARILMPNYRGSAGYGERFRALNVRNLGVGDAWDVLSGVDRLIDEGLADPERMGAMGWSQGGYISAFLATTSDRFRAISDGAGITDWLTYYVNTDIHGFTRQYLQATPWDDPAIYDLTSPISYVTQAKTPTQFQHGENDPRVPPPNAYELYQALRDRNVPTRLIVYKGFGHGINKPREVLAAMWHNYQWFARWIWQEEVALPMPEPAVDDAAQTRSGH